MLLSFKDVLKYKIAATDGELGSVHDFYFDDLEWRVRYLVVDTGNWFSGRRVLVSPVAIGRADSSVQQLHVKLTKQAVKESPSIETEKPVSRQNEKELADYFSWPYYWGARVAGGAAAATESARQVAVEAERNEQDTSLRSALKVFGYHIEANDGDIGHVEDFITDDDDWTIRYMVVDTRNWIPGKKVLMAPCLVRSVRWEESKIHLDLSRELIRTSPAYDSSAPITRKCETAWYDHHARPTYWKEPKQDLLTEKT